MSAIAASMPKRDNGLWLAAGISLAVHALLFAILSLIPKAAPPPPPAPMNVTIAYDVGLQAAAPQSVTPPAQSRAPDLGPPEDAAPPAPAPEPEPVAVKPKPAPPAPAPRPAEVAKPQPVRKPAPPQPAKPQIRPAPSGALAGIVGRGSGATSSATASRPRGSSLGSVMSGLGNTPSKSKSTQAQGATMSAAAVMDIRQKIAQQVQPCANRQVNPGPGANQIRVSLKLRINRDGSLAGRPQIVGHDGVDDDNRRYVDQVDDRAVSTFMGCQPLRGLPPELYDVPNGWSNFVMRYKLPG